MQLFPESGFDQSAITPVFLGVLLSWAFTETFGWAFVGLVVPGYLATLFWLDPRSATIDVAEAVLTYLVARLVCERLALTGATSRMFGRERFLAILAISVLVRLGVEGALIPLALPHAKWAYSIGLVLVPLAANACWKTGLLRGLFQNGVSTLIVYATLRWLLIPHTNLSLAGFHLSIESVTASFLRSPHAYVLLLTGALLAAAANVRYGWDYGGILIPALIALVVATPLKFAATFLEAAALVALVGILVRFTPLGTWNLEGARRPVLFLSVDYALRFIAAAVLGRHLPGTEIVELSGLGYLLPSLLGVKISQKGSAALVLLPTAVVSVAAFGISTAFAAALGAFQGSSPSDGEPSVTREVGAAPDSPVLAATWVSALARPGALRAANGERAATFVRTLLSLEQSPQARLPGFVTQTLHGDVLLVRERFAELDARSGRPTVLLARRHVARPRRVGLLLTPLTAPQAAALAGSWLERAELDVLVVAGIESHPHDAGGSEAFSVARRLADAGAGQGLLIGLRGAREHCTARLAPPSRKSRDARLFLAEIAELAPCEQADLPGQLAEDLVLELPPAAADVVLGPRPTPPAVSTSSALALAFAEARLWTKQTTLEDTLVLRRLLLEPLLARPDTAPTLPLMGAMATALGYQLLGPTRLPTGDEGVMLLPATSGAPLALVIRTEHANGPVVEVPHAGDRALRSLALELSKPLDASVILFGLASGAGALSNEAFATAHALATWAPPQNARKIVLFRTGGTGRTLSLSTWADSGVPSISSAVEGALQQRGLTWSPQPMDLATGEQAARAVFDDSSLVCLSVPEELLRSSALACEPSLLREWAWLPVYDSDAASALEALAKRVPRDAADAPAALFAIAEAAVGEHSISALRGLQGAAQTTATRIALVRADTAVHLAIAARREGKLMLRLFSLTCSIEAPP